MASKLPSPQRILAAKYVSHMNVRGVTAFTLQYSKNHHYSASLSQELDDNRLNSATRALYERRWNTRTEPLWWTAMTPMTVEHKRTIRSWCARRLRLAFVECLKKQGYDAAGNRILGTENSTPLVGTVQLFARPPIMKMKSPELSRQMEMALQHIILENRSPAVPAKQTRKVKAGQPYKGTEKFQEGHRRIVLGRGLE